MVQNDENEDEEEPSASGAILNFGTKTKKGGGEIEVTCSLEDGLACRAAEGGQCQDYEYRVKCECELGMFFLDHTNFLRVH